MTNRSNELSTYLSKYRKLNFCVRNILIKHSNLLFFKNNFGLNVSLFTKVIETQRKLDT